MMSGAFVSSAAGLVLLGAISCALAVPLGAGRCSKSVKSPRATVPAADKVKIALYYETMCPGCIEFITESLYPAFMAVFDITDLLMVPYGNAEEEKEGDHWKFTCQHGEPECEGNLIQTCAIHLVNNNMTAVMPFIYCMQASGDLPHDSGPTCAKQHGIDFNAVTKCMTTPLGNKLQHDMAVLTDNLKPPHQYTPWFTLNGVHTEHIQDLAEANLKKLICDTYKGPKPDACKAD
jgi:interferon gamma-inducible protein 30